MIYILCIVVTVIVVHAVFKQDSDEHEKSWKELQQTVVVENLISWSAIRAGARRAVTSKEAEIAEMTDVEFKNYVVRNLRDTGLEREALHMTKKDADTPLLGEWSVKYK